MRLADLAYSIAADRTLVADHFWILKRYRRCAIASDLVHWLVTSGYARREEDATELGRSLVDAGWLLHVEGEHHFENTASLFFMIDTERLRRSGADVEDLGALSAREIKRRERIAEKQRTFLGLPSDAYAFGENGTSGAARTVGAEEGTAAALELALTGEGDADVAGVAQRGSGTADDRRRSPPPTLVGPRYAPWSTSVDERVRELALEVEDEKQLRVCAAAASSDALRKLGAEVERLAAVEQENIATAERDAPAPSLFDISTRGARPLIEVYVVALVSAAVASRFGEQLVYLAVHALACAAAVFWIARGRAASDGARAVATAPATPPPTRDPITARHISTLSSARRHSPTVARPPLRGARAAAAAAAVAAAPLSELAALRARVAAELACAAPRDASAGASAANSGATPNALPAPSDGYLALLLAAQVRFIFFTVTFCANPANDLTCPPSYIII